MPKADASWYDDSDDYGQVRTQIAAATQRLTPDAAILAIMAVVAVTAAGGVIGAESAADVAVKSAHAAEFAASGGAATLVQPLYAFLKGKALGRPPVVPNPWFVWNGIEGDNSVCRKYIKQRRILTVAGVGISVASAAASAHTAGVNVGAAITHGNAVGSTAMHLVKLSAIARNYRQSRTISQWIDLLTYMKAQKTLVRSGQLLGSVIPGGSIPVNVAAAVAKTGIKLTAMNACYCTAAAIHWRAYQEGVISKVISGRQASDIGPGSRIFWEIFARRGLTRVIGQYDTAALIKEPGGWLPLADKLLLI